MRKPRSDRKPYNVYTRRGKWVGWYYTLAGDRITNVPCLQTVDSQPAPVPLPVTTTDPDRCPNHNRALDYMRRVYENQGSPGRRSPTLIEAIAEWGRALLLDGCEEVTTHDRIRLLEATISGVKAVGGVARGEQRAMRTHGTGWRNFQEINRHDMRQFLFRLAELGRAPATRNEYLIAWRNFLDWCVDEEIVKENAFATMRRAKQDSAAYERRPFTRQEFAALTSPDCSEHWLYYLTLGLAGLRYGESRQLIKSHLDPLAAQPLWRLPSKIQKIKLPETLPMMPRLAKAIAEHWQGLTDQALVFPKVPRRDRLYSDLRVAGIAQVNAAGEHISFHSFRFFFATEMAKRLPMRKVQILMRHKSLQLTSNLYAKLHLVDIDDRWGVPDIDF